MKDRFYTFNFRDTTGRFIECYSFRDTDYYSAKLQAIVHAQRLEYYQKCAIRTTRSYDRK